MVVEGDAGGDDVHHGGAPVGEGRMEERIQLAPVGGEAAGDEAAAELDGEGAEVDGLVGIHVPRLEPAPDVRRRRELPLREPVDPVVLHDVEQRNVPAEGVHELPDADGGGVPVPGDADGTQRAVRHQRPRRDGGHPTVHRVHRPGAAAEVGGGLGGAADARHLGHEAGLDARLPEDLHDAGRDGVVAAALAEGGLRPLVGIQGQAAAVEGLRGRGGNRGRCRGHGFPSPAAIPSIIVRASTGKPS